MRHRGSGGVINVASLAGYAPGPYQAAYYAAKAYVIALTRAVAYEVRGQGVRVCVVTPGPVETQFHARMGAEASIYRTWVPSASPAAIARSTYRGYWLGCHVIQPGLFTPVLALAMRLLPGIVLAPLIGTLLRPRGPEDARH
jgi:short-subunit dehydrogenase